MKHVLIVNRDGYLMAQDNEGNLYEINGLVIKKDEPKVDAFYEPTTNFFRAACPSGTRHRAEILSNKFVNIY